MPVTATTIPALTELSEIADFVLTRPAYRKAAILVVSLEQPLASRLLAQLDRDWARLAFRD